ncbi:GGDEF domain-containing protein [Pseudonocardia acaciae]|uniref:GGDEF domain-containing protein n=1 Tax=Pseudonocardia acaciae TaxID=551276 RepID=UPI00068755B4|nr:GGDEF domain-containing protein [Pseudonocardia acaciae]
MDTTTAAVVFSACSAGWLATAGHAARLARQLRTDQLTELPNREALTVLVRRAARRARPGRHVGLLMIDVDRFKAINDTHGHAVGNTVLQVIAGRLAAIAGPGEMAIRLHGDEFALWLGHHTTRQHAHVYAVRRGHNVRAALAMPVEAGRHRLAVTASVGAAVLPAVGLSRAALLAKADHDMYQAKRVSYRTTWPHPATTRPTPTPGEDAA